MNGRIVPWISPKKLLCFLDNAYVQFLYVSQTAMQALFHWNYFWLFEKFSSWLTVFRIKIIYKFIQSLVFSDIGLLVSFSFKPNELLNIYGIIWRFKNASRIINLFIFPFIVLNYDSIFICKIILCQIVFSHIKIHQEISRNQNSTKIRKNLQFFSSLKFIQHIDCVGCILKIEFVTKRRY